MVSKAKRVANIKAKGLDFVDAASVLQGRMFTFEADRSSDGEQRLVALSLLAGRAVSSAHTGIQNWAIAKFGVSAIKEGGLGIAGSWQPNHTWLSPMSLLGMQH